MKKGWKMKHRNDLKIAIIGAGPAGLACALECERLGVIPDVFERSDSVGWMWPSINTLLNVLEAGMGGDIRQYMKKNYRLDVQPVADCNSLMMFSAQERVNIEGNLGYLYPRGKMKVSLENQMANQLKRTAIHLNRAADYKELAKKYDYVVVANGKDTAAKELDVWEDLGRINIISGIVYGDFNPTTIRYYFNTDYAGQGYARAVPIDAMRGVLELYNIGNPYKETDKLYVKFLEQEGLEHMEFIIQVAPPIFSTGRVRQFQVGNVLLAGHAAGLTDRLTLGGCLAAMGSGVLAARAIIKEKDYNTLVKPIQDHIERISALRQVFEKIDNVGLDKMLAALNTPGIKQTMFNTGINMVGLTGTILRQFSQIGILEEK